MEGRRLLRFVTKRHVVGRVIQIAIRSSRPPTSKLSHTSIYHPPHVKLFLLRTQDTLYNVTNHRSLRSHLSYSCTNQTRCYPMKTLRHESGDQDPHDGCWFVKHHRVMMDILYLKNQTPNVD
ncbi:Protein of unknown function [Pyronema omphalodes CBS 100304]|uniref:Uncharacterized protein n=1 Tax=Pyronema omphalodes (strain CBS 100304) TaxID=1076935 RepID=U4L505_PYROM|nr:Protein of unknown function [Pyronema omphalodes CBS 100304]